MPYVHRMVETLAGVEHKKMQSYRIHTKGAKHRTENKNVTSKTQARINERKAEEELRWKLNANFKKRDLHVVLHYADKERSLLQCRADLSHFFKQLRRLCKKQGHELKYVAVTETMRMTNIHHHVVMKKIPLDTIQDAWDCVQGGGGVSLRPMDSRGNHYKLAAYLMKESRSTMRRYKEEGINGKRYSSSQNLRKPVIKYLVVAASSWRKEPKARQGARLVQFDDGATVRGGYHDVTGYPWQEYFEVYTDKKEEAG